MALNIKRLIFFIVLFSGIFGLLATGLTQEKFCKLIDVKMGTLKNWEQGRREPTGPAKALLRAIKNDPEHVLTALSTH